ncbi:MAG: hypothetical protein O2840_01840 [bacterium]|nr:hypothetical protein [bacterium]
MQKQQKTGFTFIELLVTATIIIVLSVIGAVSFAKAGQSARDSRRRADLAMVQQAMVQYKVNEGVGYPTGDFDTIVTTLQDEDTRYLSPGAIEDPKNDATYFYACTGCTTTEFTLSATLENDGSTLEFTNP